MSSKPSSSSSKGKGKGSVKKEPGEWEQHIDKATGEYIYVNTVTKEVTHTQPKWFIPNSKLDSALVKFIKFDFIGDYDLRGKKLAAVLAAIVAVGLALDYKRGHGLFRYFMTEEEKAAADAADPRTRMYQLQQLAQTDDEYDYEIIVDDEDDDPVDV